MTTKIKTLQDSSGDIILPRTRSRAVTMDDGITTLDDTLLNMNSKIANHAESLKIKKGINLVPSAWELNDLTGLYEYKILDVDITADTIVDINIKLVDLDKAGGIKSVNESYNGYVQLFSDIQPSENILCDMKLMREVI